MRWPEQQREPESPSPTKLWFQCVCKLRAHLDTCTDRAQQLPCRTRRAARGMIRVRKNSRHTPCHDSTFVIRMKMFEDTVIKVSP